jgi:acetyltransferase-like isoleucine patch superfamily enzyme
MSIMNSPIIKKAQIRNVTFGKNITIIQPVNIYGCVIGDNCFIGPFVEIQKNVLIGANCKIQSHSFICELVTIGNNCFISHGVMFINDSFSTGRPAGGNKNLWKKSLIGNNVSIGTNSTILPVKIADDIVVGAGAVVTKDLLEPGIYAGNPARKIRSL